MLYDRELAFFREIADQLHLPQRILSGTPDSWRPTEQGLRETMGFPDRFFEKWDEKFGSVAEKTVYQVIDEFCCSYILLRLPQRETPEYLLVGPYITEEVDRSWLLDFVRNSGIHRDWLSTLEGYYRNIPYLRDDGLLQAALNALGNHLWGREKYASEKIVVGIPERWSPMSQEPDSVRENDVVKEIRAIERRYEAESRMMEVVSQGHSHKAEVMLANFSQAALEQRTPEPMRNIKNYSVILNTILRKAAELGGVHPLYIDQISSDFARRIERLTKREEVGELWKEMAHKYCLLVKKHSLKQYSPLVQKVIARVDFDLAGELSLKATAQALNVNASYLSTLFKKELGMTLTDYVNRKRVEHAVYLLGSTKLSISLVGQRCGVQDDNYFTKIFKKYTGMTPRQFRQSSSVLPQMAVKSQSYLGASSRGEC